MFGERRGSRLCSHFNSIQATSPPWIGGWCRGEEGGIRKVERWALGPHPARPGAWREQRPNGAVSSVRSPHPEASRGTAASLETGF